MLTKKEIKVLNLRKDGLTQEEIAKILKITQPAVSGFLKNALNKIKDAEETVKLKKEIKCLLFLSIQIIMEEGLARN